MVIARIGWMVTSECYVVIVIIHSMDIFQVLKSFVNRRLQ